MGKYLASLLAQEAEHEAVNPEIVQERQAVRPKP